TILDPGVGVSRSAMRKANGILFDGDHPEDMLGAIDRVISLRQTPDLWLAMQLNGMKADYSWERSAPSYLSAYQALRPDVVLGRIPERRSAVVSARGLKPGMPAAVRTVPATGASAAAVLARSPRKGMDLGGPISAREPSVA